MAKGWKEELVALYPYQFQRGGFDFAVGDGWADLLAELFWRVDVALDPDWKDGSFRWTDLKEKYGTLRAYFIGPDEVERLVDWAEEASARTCDACGGEGRMRRTGGWLAVRCDRHV